MAAEAVQAVDSEAVAADLVAAEHQADGDRRIEDVTQNPVHITV
jgi:hypothetical protein